MPPTRPPVLVVDDEDAIRHVIRRSLARDGWTVEEASDGESLLRLVRDPSRAYSAILLDQSLPAHSGLELHALIAVERPDLAGRVIFATGAVPEGLEATGCPILPKPFEIAQLRALVREVAGG